MAVGEVLSSGLVGNLDPRATVSGRQFTTVVALGRAGAAGVGMGGGGGRAASTT